jgi:hypothetical protein
LATEIEGNQHGATFVQGSTKNLKFKAQTNKKALKAERPLIRNITVGNRNYLCIKNRKMKIYVE